MSCRLARIAKAKAYKSGGGDGTAASSSRTQPKPQPPVLPPGGPAYNLSVGVVQFRFQACIIQSQAQGQANHM